jgi:predicted peptidase
MNKYFLLLSLIISALPMRVQAAAPATETAAAPAPTSTPTPLGTAGEQTAQVYHGGAENDAVTTLHYWLYLPAAAKPDAKGKFPFILFLHGSGERGDQLEDVKKHGPPHLIGKNADMDSCIIISAQCPDKMWWNTKLLRKMCDDLSQRLPIDDKRRYLTGLSMGGFGTWSLLEENPTYWAAAVPICGGGKPEAAEKFKSVPIWIFHGGKDPAVPVKASEDMYAALVKAGGSPQRTIYPDVAHESWTPAYKDGALWKWLVAQKLP